MLSIFNKISLRNIYELQSVVSNTKTLKDSKRASRLLSVFHVLFVTERLDVYVQEHICAYGSRLSASSISSYANAAKLVIETLKSSKSVTIQRVIRFGFDYFNQKSTILKVIDIPRQYVNEFVNAVILDYDLPSKGSFMLGLTYSDDFAWEQIQYLYSPAMNGTYRSLTLFKNGDSIKNTASFFIVDIDADWHLAPDLLIITESVSKWGGLYSLSIQSIQEVPHVLTLDEAIKLQQFFMLVAIGNMAGSLGVNMPIPQLN